MNYDEQNFDELQLIFEMSTGKECMLAMPEPHDLSTIRHSSIASRSRCVVCTYFHLDLSPFVDAYLKSFNLISCLK